MAGLLIKGLLHERQKELFYHTHARFKVVPKGRRWGFTRGAMTYVIMRMFGSRAQKQAPVTRVLWGDTINSNIDRYINRYAFPLLRKLPRSLWHWSKQTKELRIRNIAGGVSVMDMRSADSPERWEGFGYGLILLNEAGIILKDAYLWENAVLPMAMDYKAEMIIGGTPKGKRDKKRKETSGNEYSVFYELAQKGDPESPLYDPEFITKVYTSYDNPLLDRAEVDRYVATVPAAVRDQEVYGRFVDNTYGTIFMRDWWKYYTAATLPARSEFLKIIVSWDTAFKEKQENDFSVATVWGVTKNAYYLLDMWRERALFPKLKKAARSLAASWRADWTIIEDKASGPALIAELKAHTRLHIKEIGVDRDKITRATANTPVIESGKVFIPDPLWQPWVREFIEEHSEFPNGEYDDIVDSTSQALSFMKTMPKSVPRFRRRA